MGRQRGRHVHRDLTNDDLEGPARWHVGQRATDSRLVRTTNPSTAWANTASPMQTAPQERWRRDLSTEEVVAVEAVARREMVALGYPCVTPTAELDRWVAGPLRRARWWAADRVAWVKVEARSWLRDKNVGRRWRRAWLLRGIRARLVFFGR